MKTVREKKEAAYEGFARNPLRPVIEKMAARIAEEYHPEEIILYGSQATGGAKPDSDIDLFVVKKTQENFFTRCSAVKRIVRELRGKIEVSPIVFTPEEVLLQLDRGNRFIQQILERGIQLYHDSNFWKGDLNRASKRGDSLFPQDWVRVAERDWQRVEKRLSEGDQEDAGFRLQQALEKYLKVFLLANNWELDKTHAISKLLDEAVKYKLQLKSFTDLCERVENYYLVDRDPATLDAAIPLEQVEQDFKEAHQFRAMLLETLTPKSEATSDAGK